MDFQRYTMDLELRGFHDSDREKIISRDGNKVTTASSWLKGSKHAVMFRQYKLSDLIDGSHPQCSTDFIVVPVEDLKKFIEGLT